jgi:hypothetical protein
MTKKAVHFVAQCSLAAKESPTCNRTVYSGVIALLYKASFRKPALLVRLSVLSVKCNQP